jgi:serine/threonine-protein kinase RsbW
MSLPARAENVAVVRHAIAGLAEQIGMDEPGLADLKTVVTEACMNAVVHAYPDGQPGLLEVEAEPELDGLTVIVRDYGLGIRPRPGSERSSLRIGLTLIAALSSSFEIKGGVDRGTEIRMYLPLVSRDGNATRADAASDARVAAAPSSSGATELRIGPAELLPAVLGRAVGALAARREIGVDRLSDAMLLSDAISASAPHGFSDGHVRLSIVDSDGGVELRVGPMEDGAADRLRASLDLPEVGGSLESLADEIRVERGDEGEFFVVGIAALAA